MKSKKQKMYRVFYEVREYGESLIMATSKKEAIEKLYNSSCTPGEATVTEVVQIKNCPKCDTKMKEATGIGPFCPNQACDVVDGPLGYYEEYYGEVIQ